MLKPLLTARLHRGRGWKAIQWPLSQQPSTKIQKLGSPNLVREIGSTVVAVISTPVGPSSPKIFFSSQQTSWVFLNKVWN